MEEESKSIPIYFHLSYTVKAIPNDNLDGDPFDYVVDFKFDQNSNEVVRTKIDEQSLFVIHRIAQNKEIPKHKNISVIYYLLRGIDSIIKSVFISENEEGELDLRFTIIVPNKSVFMINLDVATGVSLCQMLNLPISITEDLFKKHCIEMSNGDE